MEENRSYEENPRQGKDSKKVTVVSSVPYDVSPHAVA